MLKPVLRILFVTEGITVPESQNAADPNGSRVVNPSANQPRTTQNLLDANELSRALNMIIEYRMKKSPTALLNFLRGREDGDKWLSTQFVIGTWKQLVYQQTDVIDTLEEIRRERPEGGPRLILGVARFRKQLDQIGCDQVFTDAQQVIDFIKQQVEDGHVG